jgi:rhomboid protease GluP
MNSKEQFPFKATLGLVAVNGLIYISLFIAQIFRVQLDADLVAVMGNHRYHTLSGEWWRLITSMFIHDERLTIIVNFHALMFFGMYLEPLIGMWRMILVYLLSGLMSTAAAMCVVENDYIVGAHGAITGLAGLYIAMMISGTFPVKNWMPVAWGSLIYILVSLIFINKSDWASLLGGFVAGFITGLAYYPVFAMSENKSGHRIAVGVMTGFIALPVVVLMLLLPNKVKIYEERMEVFWETGRKSESTLENVKSLTGKKYLLQIKEDCIEGWKKNQSIVRELKNLHLPEPYYYKNKVADQYCSIQLQKARVVLRSLQNDKYYYNNALVDCNEELKYLRTQMTD